jgi:putative tryptophan/tyrosine transport system substrate-binding protein
VCHEKTFRGSPGALQSKSQTPLTAIRHFGYDAVQSSNQWGHMRPNHLRRRELITLLGGAAAAWPLAARAQQRGKPARIGYLSASSPPDYNFDSFRGGMRALGYVEGRDFVIEVRYAGRDYSKFPTLVEELLRARVDLIVAGGPASRAAPLAARSVPVVFGFSGDPVDAGIVASFARPGGNATGVSMLALDLSVKRIDLLKEAMPTMTRVAVLSNPDHAGDASEFKATRETAEALGLAIEHFEVRTDDGFEPAFAAIARSKCDGLLAFPDALANFNRQKIVAFALHRRLPSIYGWKMYAEAGGLMSYGPVLYDAFARLAVYVDKILKGAKPADLPIEQPTKLEMVVNLKTAKAIGLEIPTGLILRADQLIE